MTPPGTPFCLASGVDELFGNGLASYESTIRVLYDHHIFALILDQVHKRIIDSLCIAVKRDRGKGGFDGIAAARKSGVDNTIPSRRKTFG